MPQVGGVGDIQWCTIRSITLCIVHWFPGRDPISKPSRETLQLDPFAANNSFFNASKRSGKDEEKRKNKRCSFFPFSSYFLQSHRPAVLRTPYFVQSGCSSDFYRSSFPIACILASKIIKENNRLDSGSFPSLNRRSQHAPVYAYFLPLGYRFRIWWLLVPWSIQQSESVPLVMAPIEFRPEWTYSPCTLCYVLCSATVLAAWLFD